jgi:hypothetical protein
MDFTDCIKILSRRLHEEDPSAFSSSWIAKHVPVAYRFITKNLRTEVGHIDWDRVTIALSRKYQKRWMRFRYRCRKTYVDQAEVERALGPYCDKLYVFIAISDRSEEGLRHQITISLVRVSQRGNISAIRLLVGLLTYIVDEWIDRYFFLRRWRGAESEIDGVIEGCIRRYRYTGTFFGYLFKTFEYKTHRLNPVFSLDDFLPGTDRRMLEIVGRDAASEEIRMYNQ